MRVSRSSGVVSLVSLAAAGAAAGLAAACAPVLWKLSEQCLFFDDWAGFATVCRECGGLSGPVRYLARGLMQFAAVPFGAAAVLAALTFGATLALAAAFPRLRRPAWCGVALLPLAWLTATLTLPVMPIWLISVPEFPAFVPLLVMLSAAVAWVVRRRLGGRVALVAFGLVFAAVGGTRTLSPFVEANREVPHLRLAREIPTLTMEAQVEAGDFAGAAARPVSTHLRRLETVYRVLANYRVGRLTQGLLIPGLDGYKTTFAPEVLMDGYKPLFHFGLVLPARRVIMELASECPSEWHAIHFLYLGDIAYVTGETTLAERYYRTLARSPRHRATAKARVAALRAGRSAAEVAELSDVAHLHAAWRRLSLEKGETFYAHGQNLEAFIYDRLGELPLGTPPKRTPKVEPPVMRPDFLGATVPPNLAPFNFELPGRRDADAVTAVYTAADGDTLAGDCRAARATGARVEDCVKVSFPLAKWRAYAARHAGQTVRLTVAAAGRTLREGDLTIAAEPIDPGLVFRLVSPGYGVFGRMSITERDLESFDERTLVDNADAPVDGRHCFNCHTPLNNARDEYLRHRRGADGGIRFVTRKYGDRFVRQLKPEGWTGRGGLSYSAWHPSGEFVAFSATETAQMFFKTNPAKIEVIDLRGVLTLYSVGDGVLTTVPNEPGEMECYPTWDPTGSLLFTCCARTSLTNLTADVEGRTAAVTAQYDKLFYGVRVRRFDAAARTLSGPEWVIDGDASRMSCAFPRVSPDGRWMVVTVSPHGVFPIWHKAANLWVVDLKTLEARPAEELNSGDTESWHEFSSDGRWLVFSSRRGDGVHTRPWFARFDARTGRFDRPFPLPVRDGDDDWRRLQSYNLPTFLKR